MNNTNRRYAPLAVLALASLAVYLLACASFSPDDSKLAFPAFDPRTGDLGVGVYDRQTRRLEHVFSFSIITRPHEPRYEARMLRPQWVDNQRLIVSWPPGGNSDDGLNVVTLPIGGKGVMRQWTIEDVHQGSEKLSTPLALAGEHLLVPVRSNLICRLDLDTGRAQSKVVRGDELRLYPAGSSDFVFYVAANASQSNHSDFGKLDASTFAQTKLFEVDGGELDMDAPIAFGRDGRQVAFLRKEQGAFSLRLLAVGQPPRTIPLATQKKETFLGSLALSPKGDVAYVSFAERMKTETNCSLGFMEIPLDGRPAQRTALFTRQGKTDEDMVRYLQLGLSHDGRLLAVSSTYLSVDDDEPSRQANECGLFLADLTQKPPRITKVPLSGLTKSFK